MRNFMMNQDLTSQTPKPSLFHGHDFKVFPNELLTCPEITALCVSTNNLQM